VGELATTEYLVAILDYFTLRENKMKTAHLVNVMTRNKDTEYFVCSHATTVRLQCVGCTDAQSANSKEVKLNQQ